MKRSMSPYPDIRVPIPRPHSQDPHNCTVPERLGTHDKGGGVTYGDTFIVFTQTSLPQSWTVILTAEAAASRLAAAASAVARTIKIYLRPDEIRGDLTSLPCPRAADGFPLDRKPYFFMNASRSNSHSIGGTNSETETLLLVLRRPWCVLELCCCSLATVEALVQFAKMASEYDAKGYQGAVALLSHELSKRAMPSASPITLETATHRHIPLKRLRYIATSIFYTSVISFNGFWLRLICVCALQLDIPYSHLGRFLDDTDESEAPLTNIERNSNLAPPESVTSSGSSTPVLRVLKNSSSSPQLSKVFQLRASGLKRRITWGPSTRPGDLTPSSKALLMTVYAHVLRELMNWKV